MTFKLVYLCSNCDKSIPALCIDGRPIPPPDFCDCEAVVDVARRRYWGIGDISNGLQIVGKGKGKNRWLCRCLWCKCMWEVASSNVARQFSCGCLKGNYLKVNYFHQNMAGMVNCTCELCHLSGDYNLLMNGKVMCSSGCGMRGAKL